MSQAEKIANQIAEDVARDLQQAIKDTIVKLDLISKIPDKQFNMQTLHDSIEWKRVGKFVYLGSTLPHSYVIEDGRLRGSHVPLRPLQQWAFYKLGQSEEESWKTAKRVEKFIYENGIPPKKFIRITLSQFTRRSS